MGARRRSTGASWGSARIASARGVSILETVVALALLATGLATLAPVLVSATRMLADARDETRALALATSRLQDLEALDFDFDAVAGTALTDVSANLSTQPRSRSGTGLLPGDPSAAWRDMSAGWDWTTLDGTPTLTERTALFTRRWAVSALPAPPGTERLLIQVFARSRSREAREPARASAARRPGDVWLFTVRARHLR
jgi:type II secretory pathway pseudopilin PulG